MFTRVFPRCNVISQAIAFNLFLAFFPALLIAVALATSRIGGKTSLFDLITDFTQFLPRAAKRSFRSFWRNADRKHGRSRRWDGQERCSRVHKS